MAHGSRLRAIQHPSPQASIMHVQTRMKRSRGPWGPVHVRPSVRGHCGYVSKGTVQKTHTHNLIRPVGGGSPKRWPADAAPDLWPAIAMAVCSLCLLQLLQGQTKQPGPGPGEGGGATSCHAEQ
eukprot:scaffold8603_cov109-Isochrysis_galbana.AAC.1